MKHPLSLLISFLLFVNSIQSQNNTSNYWRLWYPEVNLGLTSDAPQGAFAVRATENELGVIVGNATLDNCNSYTIGNDRRGYVYYDNNANGGASKLLRIIDPGTNTVVNSIDYSTATPTVSALHTVNSFYISATNKHYLVLSGIGVSSATPDAAIYIYDVTDIMAPSFVKSISIPNLISFNGAAVTPRITGLVLQQSTYTSASITMYMSLDNLKRSAAVAVNPPTNTIFPGVFAKITDPLNAAPGVDAYDAMYSTTDYFGAATTGSFGPHQLAVDETNNILYLSTERNKKILAFDISGATPTATNIIYTVSTAANGGSTLYPNLGYHGIYVSIDGTTIYTGRSGTMQAGTDRALKFTRQTVAGTYTEDASKELSATTDVLVKGVNLTPDEQYLYAITYSNPAKIFLLDKTTLDTIAVQNPATATTASFFRLDPHSYAYTLHDYGDAPATYGVAAHHLVNQDYIQDRLRIGATIDGDTLAVQTTTCNGDDGSQTPKANDEDGLSAAMKAALPGLWNGQTGTYAINSITVKNTTANAATLIGWIDFDHNGTFDADEAASIAVPINTTSVNLLWTIPSDVTSGPVYIRLRLSTDGSLTTSAATTVLFDGEAEDHYIPTIPVSGNIFNDVNGNTILSGESNISTLTLYAYIIKNGVIVDSAHVLADGTYSFTNAAQNMSTATIVLATNSLAPGTSAASITNITTNPPAGWVYTGESSGGATGGTDGVLSISLATSAITQQNFGLQRLPESAVNLQPTVGNPGGFNSNAVPAGAFQTNNVGATPNTQDYDGGTVTSMRITAFPSNANSITINGTVYTNGGTCPPATSCTVWPGAGVTVPYTNGTGPTQAISVDPVEGNVDVIIPFAAIDNAGKEDATPGSVTVPFRTITLSGTVWNDANGNLIQNGAEAVVNGTNTGGGVVTGAVLYANLIDAGGNVIATAPVASDGTYSFPNVPQSSTGLVVQLSQNQGTIGLAKPATALPTGWVTTGENKNGQGGPADATANGEIPVTTITTNITAQNFGIERTPTSPNQSYTIAQPAINTLQTLNGTGAPNSPGPLNGTDPEDGTLGTGNTFNIVSVAGLNGNKLFYNGVEITGPVSIPSYNPALLQVQYTALASTSLSFTFNSADAAGKLSNTASYTINWLAPLPLQRLEVSVDLKGTTVVVNWLTENELNVTKFIVERSTDNRIFTAVAEKPGAGNNSALNNFYNSSDDITALMSSTVIYYRIKVIDNDGKIGISKTVVVRIGAIDGIKIWPNPFIENIVVVINSDITQQVKVHLFDSKGSIVASAVYSLVKGNNQVNFKELIKLPKGSYLLTITDKKGKSIISKIMTK